MRIAFCYPPFTKNGHFPNLPQNRQFIYEASNEVKIYPVVLATAATWLKNLGHEVLWLDGVTRRFKMAKFNSELNKFKPDIVILECKAPIMNKIWNFINNNKFPKSVIVGDHVSFFPEESFKKSKVDYILTGGDYDFLIKDLVEHITKGKQLGKGVWYRENRSIKNTGEFVPNNDLNKVPVIDRELTRWKDYGEAYLYHPCAYIMSGRGCGINKERCGICTFCIWEHALWKRQARLARPEQVIKEIKNLTSLGVKEIFDDCESGGMWDIEWLKRFYKLLKKEKLLGKVTFSSNARGDQLTKEKCQLLKKLNYRLLKVGLESGSNNTLERIAKREEIEDIIQGVKTAKDAGLRVMLTVMVGYPWETEEEVQITYDITKKLLLYKTRAGDCLQSSVIVSYPGTPLWNMAKANKWLKINPLDYEKYDMSKPILKSKYNPTEWCQKIWSIQSSPLFIAKSAIGMDSFQDMVLLARGAKSLVGHMMDFS
jgi:radical SAM superfamily enzyme YgiQ (UPF0313 family)